MARIIGTERGSGGASDDSGAGGASGGVMRSGGRSGGRKPSFRTRGPHGGSHATHGRTIRATKVTLPANKVRELASKFNAVIVDREVDSRPVLSSQSSFDDVASDAASTRTSSTSSPIVSSSTVLATIQRFEGIMLNHKGPRFGDRLKRVLVRTNSRSKEISIEKIKKIPETVPEEEKKKALDEAASAERTEIMKRLDGSTVSQGSSVKTPGDVSPRIGVDDVPKAVSSSASALPVKTSVDKESKPEIKPKPPDLSGNIRGSLGNLTKIIYKESYSKKNKRLSLPKVAILEELLTDKDRNKRPNSSFLWGGKSEKAEAVEDLEELKKPEVEPRKPEIEVIKPDVEISKPEVEPRRPEVEPRKPEVGAKIPEVAPVKMESSVNSKPVVSPNVGDTERSVSQNKLDSEKSKVGKEAGSKGVNKIEASIDLTNLIANRSSLYRHLGRSQDNVSSLRRSHESISSGLGQSRESVTSEGQEPPPVLSRVRERTDDNLGSRSSLASQDTVKSSPEVVKDREPPAGTGARVSFSLPSDHNDGEGEHKGKKIQRAPSIRSNASYEDIGPSSRTYEDLTENNYAVIAEYDDTEAIYDDVLNVVPQAPEGIYECIYGGSPKEDSDSSLEHQNSLYDHRPASQASSGSGGHLSAASKSDTSDEWIDIELEDKDRKEEFILLEEKSKPKNIHDSWSQRVRRQWSHRIAEEFKSSRVAISSPSGVYLLGTDSDVKRPSYGELLTSGPHSTRGLVSLRDVVYCGESYEAQEVTIHLRSEGEPSEEVYEAPYDESAALDDFDDSSDSDGESGGRSGGFDLVHTTHHGSSSPPQSGGSGRESEGIYGFMMSAGKKVKKTSWSISQRLRRRMSKISISVSNGGAEPATEVAEGGNQKRWPSFKKKAKGSTSKFYLEAAPSPPTDAAPVIPPPFAAPVLPPFRESKRPSLDLPASSQSSGRSKRPSLDIPLSLPPSTSPTSTSPSAPHGAASLPLVLPPLRDPPRRPSPPLLSSKSSPPSSVDMRRMSTALPSGLRPTSPPPPPPPPLVNGESKSATTKSVNDPTLYLESGLFGQAHAQNGSLHNNHNHNHSYNETSSNYSGSSGKSQTNSQWYSDVGLYENTSENGEQIEESREEPPARVVRSTIWHVDLGIDIDRHKYKYAPSEADSGHSSQLDLQFADEPLYQFYAARVAELEQSENNSDIGYEEIGPNSVPGDRVALEIESLSHVVSGGVRPSALDLVSPESIHRTLWCQVPQVINSGILESLTPNQKRLQEAKFELITSEASYYKSLTVLDRTFANSPAFKDEAVIPKVDYKTLFGNISTVRQCSESMLAGLEKCWQDSILLDGVCDVILEVANDKFKAYNRYCSHQVAIERTLKRLKKNPVFLEKLAALESTPACHSLSLSSFLLLPMQRVTRLPLLMDAIMTKFEVGSSEFPSCQAALLALNKVVHDCNEAARTTERLEEMGALSRAIVFPKHIRPLPLMSASRWLVRSGQVIQYNPDTKLTFSKKLTAPRQTKLTLFLFTDLFFITKKKSDDSFTVLTYCPRNFVQMSAEEDPLALPGAIPTRFLLSITILENHERKTQELVVSCNSESCRERWLQPFSRPTSEDPDQVLYETWDCPQVVASHSYPSTQPDELSLQLGDVVNVLTKMADGWFYGERLRDSEKGWFPGNHVTEVASAHVRARNLRQRHRLLALSSTIIQQRQLQT